MRKQRDIEKIKFLKFLLHLVKLEPLLLPMPLKSTMVLVLSVIYELFSLGI